MVKELAPGIIVYSIDTEKIKNYYEILKTYSDPLMVSGQVVGSNRNGYYSKVDLHTRNCKTFSALRLAECHDLDPLKIMANEVQNIMNEFVGVFCRRYQAHSAVPNHEMIFLRYGEGEFFVDHNDDCPTYPRTVSSIIYFNDDYEGGEICFKYFDIQYTPNQGDCIVFSSAFPYMHSVNKVISGTRYAAVNWYKYI